jgi:hypothetical protein
MMQGPDGVRKLRQGPDIASYRGLKIINSRCFSMEEGAPPRDVLRRRVRVAEYYRIPYVQGVEDQSFAFYDESKDAWQKFSWHDQRRMALIGDVNEMEDNDADWDDVDSHLKERATRLPNYGYNGGPVDVMLGRLLFLRMTAGEIEGGIMEAAGVQLHQLNGGNLVLNPWYALHGWDANNGRAVPTDAGVADMHLRAPYAAGHPSNGTRLGAAPLRSEYRFQGFYEFMQAFGYRGRSKFTDKPVTAIAVIEAAAVAAAVAAGTYQAYADGSNPIPSAATEANYTGYLNDRACDGSLRGHPEYAHRSYEDARETFHRFFMLYISGRAQMLPAKAKEFFDNFNWQGFGAADDNARASVFRSLIRRIYNFERVTATVVPGTGTTGINAANLNNFLVENVKAVPKSRPELVVVRPNIEHNMLGIIMVRAKTSIWVHDRLHVGYITCMSVFQKKKQGRGGLEELGATFWGQTELSCYDDSMHGMYVFSSCFARPPLFGATPCELSDKNKNEQGSGA